MEQGGGLGLSWRCCSSVFLNPFFSSQAGTMLQWRPRERLEQSWLQWDSLGTGTATGEHIGAKLSTGGLVEEPMEGKGPLCGVHIPHGFALKQPGFCPAKLFLSP